MQPGLVRGLTSTLSPSPRLASSSAVRLCNVRLANLSPSARPFSRSWPQLSDSPKPDPSRLHRPLIASFSHSTTTTRRAPSKMSADTAPASSAPPPTSPSPLHQRLHHALARIDALPARHIQSPPTQPRRASVAILVRIRPHPSDEEELSEQYDTDGLPVKGGRIDRWMSQGIEEESPDAGDRDLAASAASVGDAPLAGSQFTNLEASTAGGPDLAASGASSAVASAAFSASGAPSTDANRVTLSRFFSLPWVQRGTPEILYIKRSTRQGDKWSAHVAFPGGRREEEDENGLYTAMRETWEEVGIDLAEKEFLGLGKLDDREITTSLGKRLLMVLSPYVFLQTSPFSPLPDLQPSEVASAHWIPLSLLYTPRPKWGLTSVDIAQRLAPKSPAVRWALRAFVGMMDFRCILLPNNPVAVAEFDEREEEGEMQGGAKIEKREEEKELKDGERPELRLWGLTLGMTLDLMAQMSTLPSNNVPLQTHTTFTPEGMPVLSSTSNDAKAAARLQQVSSSSSSRDVADRRLPSERDGAVNPTGLSRLRILMAKVRDELHLNPPPQAGALAPSMTSVFPRFSYPDVNFWIWVFSWRYRAIVRGWERNLELGMERSIDWSGLALGAFYSAVRRALVVAILMRALGFISAASLAAWLTGRKVSRQRKGLPGLGLEELFA